MRVVSIVGARPQFIKLAPLHRELTAKGCEHSVINTGQHYDHNLSRIFFDELVLPKPKYDLGVGSADNPTMTARILELTAAKLPRLKPDLVIVYGDTNSTLAGALAAAQLKLPLAHVEAGLRCHDLNVPEELNRVITDRISDLLFCPTPQARLNLRREGITRGVYLTGDVLYDVMQVAMPRKSEVESTLDRYGIKAGEYLLLTFHRAEAVDNKDHLGKLVDMLSSIDETVLFPMHPRTRKRLRRFGLMSSLSRRGNIIILEPCSYRQNLALINGARMVLTDSGGVQREAYRLRVPVLLLRNVTEWVELTGGGGVTIVGFDHRILERGLRKSAPSFTNRQVCRTGAARRIAALIARHR
jgi:UDP-N-acetylglucosamine 2-epimerase